MYIIVHYWLYISLDVSLFDSQSLPFSNFLQFLLKSMTVLSFVAIDFKKGLHDTFVINALLLKTKLKFSGT